MSKTHYGHTACAKAGTSHFKKTDAGSVSLQAWVSDEG